MFSVLAVCLVVSSSIASAMSSFTVSRSSVVLIGDRVEMKCSVTGSDLTTWTYNAWDASTVTNIYLGEDIVTSMRSRYKIDKRISGQHNIIIDSVDFTYAGRYRCTAAIQKTLWNDIQLTVLVSPPNCSSNTSNADRRIMENGNMRMMCRIIYRPTGNMIPIFTWTKDNKKNVIVANTTTAFDNSTIPLTTTSSVLVLVHSDDNGATFMCQITFQLLNNTEVYATDYEYTWNLTVYGPRNLSIVRHGDRLECSADGNPTPIYRWTDVDTNRFTDGPHFILDRPIDNERTFKCTATNTFAAESKNYTIKAESVDKSITLSTSSEEKSSTLSTAGVALILASLSLTGVVFLSLGLGLSKLLSFFNAGGEFRRRSDSQDRAGTTQTDPSASKDPQIVVTDAEYCAIMHRPTTLQQPELYCELRLNDQPSDDYINQPSAEQKLPSTKKPRTAK